MQREAEIAAWPALANRVTSSHPSIDNRSFEKNAWDVQFTFGGASSEIDTSSEPECECTPLPLPDVSDEPIHARHVGDDAVFDRELEEWRRLLAVQRLARDARSAVSAINKNRDTSDYTPACMSLRGLRSGRVSIPTLTVKRQSTRSNAPLLEGLADTDLSCLLRGHLLPRQRQTPAAGSYRNHRIPVIY